MPPLNRTCPLMLPGSIAARSMGLSNVNTTDVWPVPPTESLVDSAALPLT